MNGFSRRVLLEHIAEPFCRPRFSQYEYASSAISWWLGVRQIVMLRLCGVVVRCTWLR